MKVRDFSYIKRGLPSATPSPARRTSSPTSASPGSTSGQGHIHQPSAGGWSPPPLGEKYYGVNPYAYCNGDPVNYVDP